MQRHNLMPRKLLLPVLKLLINWEKDLPGLWSLNLYIRKKTILFLKVSDIVKRSVVVEII